MCIHTHTNSKLMRKLTALMLSAYAAAPVTLVNYRKDPHEHFTLYASGHEGAQRAANLLNAWHSAYRGDWAQFTENSFPRIRNPYVDAAFPSIEWPDKPSSAFVATICFAYGTMTNELPDVRRCYGCAREQLPPGPELDLALRLIQEIRGEAEPVAEAVAEDVAEAVAEDVAAAQADPVGERKSYSVVYRDENGNYITDTYDDTHSMQIVAGGVLGVVKEDGSMAALYADGTWETVR